MLRRLTALLIFGLAISSPASTFAYDEQTTHPALTDAIIDFYNLSYPGDPVTQEERELIVKGVILEDTPPRWINHFYDPVRNIAWTGENTGWLSPETVQAWRSAVLWPDEPLKSVDWVNNRVVQKKYARYEGDRTWAQALEYWAKGNAAEAWRTLGYVLHLLEDATVPEHTRNDPHAHDIRIATGDYGSPYEEYTKKWTRGTIGILQIADSLKNNGVAPTTRSSVEEYITAAAQYSNRYFFSKDTINDPAYEFPKIARNDSNFGYGLDEIGKEFPLARARILFSASGEVLVEYSLENNKEVEILDAYFYRLSRKAVIEGAGAIKLFKDQARKAAADYEINKEFASRLQVIDPEFSNWWNYWNNFSATGELAKLGNAVEATGSFFVNTASGILSFFQNLGGLTLAVFDKFVATVGPGQTTVAPRSESAATSTPSQPTTATTTLPKPITASPTAVATIQNNPAPSSPTSSPAVVSTSTSNTNVNTPVVWGVSGTPTPTGGISVSGGSPPPGEGGETPPNSSSTGILPASTLPAIENFQAEFQTSTLEIHLSWSPFAAPATSTYYLGQIEAASSTPLATTTDTSFNTPAPGYNQTFTYSIEARDENGSPLSKTATTTVSVPDWLFTIQGVKDEGSHGVHSNSIGNWYQLGTGFYGTIYAMVLDGAISGGNYPDNTSSFIELQEFLDPNYSVLNRSFVIANGVIFTSARKEILIKGLNMQIQPNKYYRLKTTTNFQNSSVILFGSSTSTPNGFTGGGTAMFNEFVPPPPDDRNAGGTFERYYSFYPFLQVVRQPDFPPQSAPSSPEITALDFDDLNLLLNVRWASSTDADTTDNLIKYEFNYSTSSELTADGWLAIGGARSFTIGLEFPNSYTIGVRAKDDFGNTSPPTIVNWSFPEGFIPFVLSNPVGGATQDFVLARGGAVKSIKVFTSDFQTNKRNPDGAVCFLNLLEVTATTTIDLATADRPNPGGGASSPYAYRGYGCGGGELTYTFSSSFANPGSPPRIEAGKTYRWLFGFELEPTNTASVRFYGRMTTTAGGLFSDPSLVNARFEIDSDSGVLFAN